MDWFCECDSFDEVSVVGRYVVRDASNEEKATLLGPEFSSGEARVIVLNDAETGSEVVILPSLGNTVVKFTTTLAGEALEVIEGPPDYETLEENPILYGNPILFPFPNRIRNGKFEYQGKSYSLTINEPERGHAIHGLVYTRPWQVSDMGASDADGAWVTCLFDSRDFPELKDSFPSSFTLTYTYRLKDGALINEFTAQNVGDERMPYGFGVHPWFPAPLSSKGSRAECRLHAPVDRIWELDAGLVPLGERIKPQPQRDLSRGPRLGAEEYDDVYSDLRATSGTSESRLADPATGAEVVVTADQSFRELVIYAPHHRDVVCIEPYTCTTDAFNLEARGIDAGMRELDPGQSYSGVISYAVRAYDPQAWA